MICCILTADRGFANAFEENRVYNNGVSRKNKAACPCDKRPCYMFFYLHVSCEISGARVAASTVKRRYSAWAEGTVIVVSSLPVQVTGF